MHAHRACACDAPTLRRLRCTPPAFCSNSGETSIEVHWQREPQHPPAFRDFGADFFSPPEDRYDYLDRLYDLKEYPYELWVGARGQAERREEELHAQPGAAGSHIFWGLEPRAKYDVHMRQATYGVPESCRGCVGGVGRGSVRERKVTRGGVRGPWVSVLVAVGGFVCSWGGGRTPAKVLRYFVCHQLALGPQEATGKRCTRTDTGQPQHLHNQHEQRRRRAR